MTRDTSYVTRDMWPRDHVTSFIKLFYIIGDYGYSHSDSFGRVPHKQRSGHGEARTVGRGRLGWGRHHGFGGSLLLN